MAEDDAKRNGCEMEEGTMTPGLQQPQTAPVQMPQSHDLLVLAAPMPGLEPADIAVTVRRDQLTMGRVYRGSRHDQPEMLLSKWTVGPYYREVRLLQLVDGALTNATSGNGVLVLSMPKLAPGAQERNTEFRLAGPHRHAGPARWPYRGAYGAHVNVGP